jgi:ribulose-phosphate 3-epimerase
LTVRDLRLGPSLLSADLARAGEQIAELEAAGADFLHFDVMDGVFVPNISFGLPLLEAIRPVTTMPIDVHLMIVQPEKYVDAFAKAGADSITVHVEATDHLNRVVHQIAETGALAGVTLNPGTPLAAVEEVVGIAGQILVMSVNPGFGGQSFIPSSLNKIARLRAMIDERNPACRLEVDGGVKAENVGQIVRAGADTFVAGSAIFQPGRSLKASVSEFRAAMLAG